MGVRVYKDLPRVYFDMDGVLYGYEKLAQDLAIPVKALKLLPGAYEVMQPLPGAFEAVEAALTLGYDVWALTKAPKENPSAASDKIRSIYRDFPMIGEQVVITPDKGCVGTSRDTLVDDHPEWANANNFPGTILKFEGHWGPIVRALIAAKENLAN